MTATTMGYHRRGNGSGGGGGLNSNNAIFGNPQADILERFFDGWESFFCGATQSKESLAKETLEEPDVFDYVFDSVESFTCREGSSTPRDYPNDYRYQDRDRDQERQRRGTHKGYGSEEDDLALRRENSLVEQGPSGGPVILHLLSKPRDQHAKHATQHASVMLGREGDFLDYCFEHVESYVCSEGGSGPEYDFGRNQSLSSSKASSYYNYSNTSSKGSYPLPTRNTTNQQQADHERGLEWELEESESSAEQAHPIPSQICPPRYLRHQKKKNRRRHRREGQKQNFYPDEEDNVLLYYRPMKQDE